jgi:hypothetical protein
MVSPLRLGPMLALEITEPLTGLACRFAQGRRIAASAGPGLAQAANDAPHLVLALTD